MDIFKMIGKLKTEEPDVKKTVKWMNILGLVCLGVLVWNFSLLSLVPAEEWPIQFSAKFKYTGLFGLLINGLLFFLSALNIKRMKHLGKRLGQLSIIMLLIILCAFGLFIFNNIPTGMGSFMYIFLLLFLAQFAVPAYFGVLYLDRLPTED